VRASWRFISPEPIAEGGRFSRQSTGAKRTVGDVTASQIASVGGGSNAIKLALSTRTPQRLTFSSITKPGSPRSNDLSASKRGNWSF
jgi:hypothetical protein